LKCCIPRKIVSTTHYKETTTKDTRSRTQVCALTIQFDADINILVLVQAKLLFQYLSNTVSNKNQWDKFIDAHVNNWSFKTKTETLATPQLQKQQFTSLA